MYADGVFFLVGIPCNPLILSLIGPWPLLHSISTHSNTGFWEVPRIACNPIQANICVCDAREDARRHSAKGTLLQVHS